MNKHYIFNHDTINTILHNFDTHTYDFTDRVICGHVKRWGCLHNIDGNVLDCWLDGKIVVNKICEETGAVYYDQFDKDGNLIKSSWGNLMRGVEFTYNHYSDGDVSLKNNEPEVYLPVCNVMGKVLGDTKWRLVDEDTINGFVSCEAPDGYTYLLYAEYGEGHWNWNKINVSRLLTKKLKTGELEDVGEFAA